jgi:hypothetical protein
VNPELAFLLGPGWKLILGAFAWGVLYAQQRENSAAIKSFRAALFGENGDGPVVVTNMICLEREERIGRLICAAKDSAKEVDVKVDALGAKVTDIDGRLLVVESRSPG